MGRKSREKQLRRMERKRFEPAAQRRRAMELFGFEIETGRLELPEEPLPSDVADSTQEFFYMIKAEPEAAIPRLEELIEKYPAKPTFKNWLTVAYMNTGHDDRARSLIERTIREHPNYLFSKLNLANIYLQDGLGDEIPLIFGEKTDLSEIYPERKKFHITEFTGFYCLMARYALWKRDVDGYLRSFATLKLGAPE